jgi:hypothetical protein
MMIYRYLYKIQKSGKWPPQFRRLCNSCRDPGAGGSGPLLNISDRLKSCGSYELAHFGQGVVP